MLSPQPIIFNSKALIKAKASYFAGGALPDAPIVWNLSTNPTTFIPPGQSQYAFSIVNSQPENAE